MCMHMIGIAMAVCMSLVAAAQPKESCPLFPCVFSSSAHSISPAPPAPAPAQRSALKTPVVVAFCWLQMACPCVHLEKTEAIPGTCHL